MAYKKGPAENTLTINTTHQMLKYFEDRHPTRYRHLVAFSPTRKWENLTGYDVRMSFLKSTVFQYKRPKVPDNSTPVHSQNRRFGLSQEQWLTLLLLFDRGEAFFTLPEVMSENKLSESRNRTVFVDVYGILPNTSLAYVPPNTCRSGVANDFLLGKIRNGSKYPIHPDHVYGWEEICEGIHDCSIGFRIGTLDQRPERFHEFERRISRVTELDEQEWWDSRLRRVLQSQREEYAGFYSKLVDLEDRYPPEGIYGIDPSESETWEDIIQIISQDDVYPEEEVGLLLDENWVTYRIEDRIQKLEETETDPSTYRIKSSKVNLFGR